MATWRKSKRETQKKIRTNWDSPYQVTDSLQVRVYKLKKLIGKLVSRTWNATNKFTQIE